MSKSFIRTRFTWVLYILLALYAYFINIPGPITPFLRDELGLSYTATSLHFSAFAVGILVVGLAGHLVIDRIGRRFSLAVGAIGLGLGALLLVIGRNPVVTVAAIFLMGCVGSLILAVVPPALSEEHGENSAVAISEANVLSSIVAAAAPLLVGWLAGFWIGWRLALIVAALLAVGVGGVLFRLGGSSQAGAVVVRPAGGLPGRFWFYWICLVLAVSVEFCMVFWSADFMEGALGMPRAGAAQAVSLFLLGMIVGRLVSSRLLAHMPARRVVLGSVLLALAGFMLYWSAASPFAGMAGLTLTGLGTAGLYPLILSMAIRSAPGREAQAGARTTLASGTAILALPLALGRVADLIGLKPAFAVVAGLLGVLLVLILTMKAQEK